MLAVGGPHTFCNLLPRFPGIYLFPVFAPFMFGPQKCCGYRGPNNNKMQLSFFHTYINILIWGVGGVVILQTSSLTRYGRSSDTLELFLLSILPGMILTILLTLLYQISETACCLKCCCPFTQRSVHSTDEDQQKTKTRNRLNPQEHGFELHQIV